MTKVTLEFSNLELLAAFSRTIPLSSYVILPDILQITCYCDDIELLEAVNNFKAKIISKQV